MLYFRARPKPSNLVPVTEDLKKRAEDVVRRKIEEVIKHFLTEHSVIALDQLNNYEEIVRIQLSDVVEQQIANINSLEDYHNFKMSSSVEFCGWVENVKLACVKFIGSRVENYFRQYLIIWIQNIPELQNELSKINITNLIIYLLKKFNDSTAKKKDLKAMFAYENARDGLAKLTEYLQSELIRNLITTTVSAVFEDIVSHGPFMNVFLSVEEIRAIQEEICFKCFDDMGDQAKQFSVNYYRQQVVKFINNTSIIRNLLEQRIQLAYNKNISLLVSQIMQNSGVIRQAQLVKQEDKLVFIKKSINKSLLAVSNEKKPIIDQSGKNFTQEVLGILANKCENFKQQLASYPVDQLLNTLSLNAKILTKVVRIFNEIFNLSNITALSDLSEELIYSIKAAISSSKDVRDIRGDHDFETENNQQSLACQIKIGRGRPVECFLYSLNQFHDIVIRNPYHFFYDCNNNKINCSWGECSGDQYLLLKDYLMMNPNVNNLVERIVKLVTPVGMTRDLSAAAVTLKHSM